ncbi:hypothetical protein THAOC_36794, partial [Thalassiosira oceanica]
ERQGRVPRPQFKRGGIGGIGGYGWTAPACKSSSKQGQRNEVTATSPTSFRLWAFRQASRPGSTMEDTKSVPTGDTPSPACLELSLDSIFLGKDYRAESFSQPRWWASGSCYTALVKSTDQKDTYDPTKFGGSSVSVDEKTGGSASPKRDLVWHDVASNTSATYVSSDLLIPPGYDAPLSVDDYALSPDKSRLLIFTNSQKVWRKKTRGDYWVLDITARDLRQLGGPLAKPSSLMFATFSPCGNKVAYVMMNNLYVQDVHTFKITPLTTDGSPMIINGTFDWVYEEEFRTGVRVVNLINNTDHLYPQLLPIPYPKAGEQNPSCRVGIVNVNDAIAKRGGSDVPEVQWISIPGDPRYHYIASLDWIPGTHELVFQRLNRLQNTVHVVIAEPDSGKIRIAFTDRDDAWIDLQSAAWYGEESSGIRFLDGSRFLWLSERNGWRQLFLVSTNGMCNALTPPTFDVTEIAGVDEEGGWAYYIASPEDPLRRYLFRTPLNLDSDQTSLISSPQERITPSSLPGTHSYRFSRDGKHAIHVYSTFSTPEITDIVRLPDHKTVAVLADNKELRDRLLAGSLPKPEFFRIPIEDGRLELDAYAIHPPNFDPKKKYAVLIYVYGEPAMSVVRDMWGGRTSLWHTMLAQKNYVVISIDNRGTPSPRGRYWRFPNLYSTALSVAPVPNQRVYDTIYQERYMGLPSDNVEGYRDGSPITHARNLKGNLLLVHGTGDDNCHYGGTEVLINELILHNKQFSMFSYPNRSHSISEGSNTTRHLFSLLTNFLETNVPSDIREIEEKG